MKIDVICVITLPNGLEVTMTPKEFIKFHQELNNFYNDHYETIHQNENS